MERLKNFIDQLNRTIPVNYKYVNEIFNHEYEYPELDILRDEICKCILCGLYQASITLTNHLLESSLKKCLMLKFLIRNNRSDICAKEASVYGGKDLRFAIDKACSEGLISKKQKIHLHEFREKYRNAYSHADSVKILGNMEVPINPLSLKDFNHPEDMLKACFQEANKTVKVCDLSAVQGIAQIILAEQTAFRYFRDVDGIIRDMLSKLRQKGR